MISLVKNIFIAHLNQLQSSIKQHIIPFSYLSCSLQQYLKSQQKMNLLTVKESIKNSSAVSPNLFSQFLVPLSSKRSELLSQYKSARNNQDEQPMNLITDLLGGIDQSSQANFIGHFVYGVQMEMWRKTKIKKVVVFLDQNIPNLVWFSSNTKAFLLDMTYTDIDRCDFQLQKQSGVEKYLILRCFQQQIPLLFRGNAQKDEHKYFDLFNNYIKYNRLRQYPPFLSRVMKLYTMEEVKSNISRKHYATDILNVTSIIGSNSPEKCKEILQKVYYKSRNKTMPPNADLSDQQVSDYFKILHCSQDLITVFEKYSKKRIVGYDYLQRIMSNSSFTKFLIDQQGYSAQKTQGLAKDMQSEINFYEFCSYLQNEKVNYAAQTVQIDENYSLTDYFCYSSHNTYLSGNQLTSDCRIERYLEDLERGLKCVQIDIHNDGDTPIINHALKGKSFCKPIDFQQTIKEIAKFCDSNPNHYPIILSLQNHAKQQNRYKVCNILMKYLFKRILFVGEDEHLTYFKTLNELKGRVIIKTDSKLSQIALFKKKTAYELKENALKLYSPQPKFPSKSFQERYGKFQEKIKDLIKRKDQFDESIPNSLFLPIPEMTKVTSIFKSQLGIEKNDSVGYQCTSLTNSKAAKQKEQKIIAYTKRSFLRIYPQSSEIFSNNFNPVHHLKIGAQIIALNTQTKQKQTWMLMSYFRSGRPNNTQTIGYILKPRHLRTSNPKQIAKKIITIDIISKEQKVQVEFQGTQKDKIANEKLAEIRKKKGQVTGKFPFEVVDHDQAFLLFKIGQKLKDCIPVRFLRSGYRVLVAKNKLFLDSGIRVIIHIQIQNIRD